MSGSWYCLEKGDEKGSALKIISFNSFCGKSGIRKVFELPRENHNNRRK
jgi:hypothetical protein